MPLRAFVERSCQATIKVAALTWTMGTCKEWGEISCGMVTGQELKESSTVISTMASQAGSNAGLDRIRKSPPS